MNETKKLILIGCGGHCHSVIDVIHLTGLYEIVGILDKQENIGKIILGYPVVGTDDEVDDFPDCEFVITIGTLGNSSLREDIYSRLVNKVRFATIISPLSHVSSFSEVGHGSVVHHGVIINSNVSIGDNCIINSQALVEHDCVIGDHTHISTGAVVNGNASIGKGSFLGSHSVVIQGSKVKPGSCIKANQLYYDKKRTAVLTVIYPTDKRYIDDYCLSLVNQTDKYFDVLLMNDGFGSLDRLRVQYPELSIIELASEDCIAKNRESLIKQAIELGYYTAVFADIDDILMSSRIEVSKKYLKKYDVVVNDYTSFNDTGLIERRYISRRYCNGDSIYLDDILLKNIFGLSNTAINLKRVEGLDFTFPKELIAVDWYFYSLILFNQLSAVFINETETLYRQHSGNIIGSNNEDLKKKQQMIVDTHYACLDKTNVHFYALREMRKKNEIKSLHYPLWWE
ncbi:NeuD/PglB/VioB family sugar acetyltransferase [Shewanella atlantica]|uniref:Family 2 glycosyl transferase n=1 Tax=Shewanella atlantica TaxID=271099 RepID=A0A3S0IF70_9GAMM|nr:NeuD/PglB/VioB family sugar acetyltransferase [Shewanella atlantica]RTR32536.1 family 2 glycosyl transferase [Shewanella atlantica]